MYIFLSFPTRSLIPLAPQSIVVSIRNAKNTSKLLKLKRFSFFTKIKICLGLLKFNEFTMKKSAVHRRNKGLF